MNKEGVKEFMPPVGEKPITLEDVKGVGEAKDVCPSCIDLYTTDRKRTNMGGLESFLLWGR